MLKTIGAKIQIVCNNFSVRTNRLSRATAVGDCSVLYVSQNSRLNKVPRMEKQTDSQ